MKLKPILFVSSVLLFIIVFYDKFVGINLSILSILLLVMSYYVQVKKGITTNYQIAVYGGIISALSFAYYGNFLSFVALFFSLHWVAMLMFDPQQKMIKTIILSPLNYIMMLPNVADTQPQFDKGTSKVWFKKIVAYAIIPLFITMVFAIVYIMSSDIMSDFFRQMDFSFNLNVGSVLWLTFLGSALMYLFWYFEIPQYWNIVHDKLNDEYASSEFTTLSNSDVIRKSAEITFIMLNITLLIFIGIYGVENLYRVEQISSVSSNVHERVYAVILSIVMAISLILYFFRGAFNFDAANRRLKKLTYGWIVLNAVLIMIAFAKNMEYVYMLGLTEKRIGVFVFLILCWIGLYLTLQKVRRRKTNWYLINRMAMISYFTALLMAVTNWSWIITKYNISAGIDISADIYYYHEGLYENDVVLYEYYKSRKDQNGMDMIYDKILHKPDFPSLDGFLYTMYAKYKLQAWNKAKY